MHCFLSIPTGLSSKSTSAVLHSAKPNSSAVQVHDSPRHNFLGRVSRSDPLGFLLCIVIANPFFIGGLRHLVLIANQIHPFIRNNCPNDQHNIEYIEKFHPIIRFWRQFCKSALLISTVSNQMFPHPQSAIKKRCQNRKCLGAILITYVPASPVLLDQSVVRDVPHNAVPSGRVDVVERELGLGWPQESRVLTAN